MQHGLDRLSPTAPPLALPQVRSRSRARVDWREPLVAFALGLVAYGGLAIYFVYQLDVLIGDAAARTASAFFVLFSRDPHLGAIGFVWNPLPSLLQLPILPVLQALGVRLMLAGNLQSAFASAGTLAVLVAALRQVGMPPVVRWGLLALYGLNPMIWLYASNGMSEALFILLIVTAVVGLVLVARTNSTFGFTLLAVASAAALWTRYEALALVAALVVALVLVSGGLGWLAGWLRSGRRAALDAAGRLRIRRTEALVVAYVTVAAYAFGLWMLMNWMLLDDPLYFLNSAYGNTSQTAQFRTDDETSLSGVVGSVGGAAAYSLDRTAHLFPAFLAIVPVALVVAWRRRSRLLLALVVVALAIPLFQTFMLFRGTSFGWLRFFMYGIPFSLLLVMGIWLVGGDLFRGRRGLVLWPAIFGVFLASNLSGWHTMSEHTRAPEEWVVVRKLVTTTEPAWYQSFYDSRQLVAYTNQIPAEETILVETFLAYAVPLFVPDPKRFVVTSDRDFIDTLRQPYGKVEYILVPKPAGLGVHDRINKEYPELWARGAPWVELTHEFTDTEYSWKLYRVVGNP